MYRILKCIASVALIFIFALSSSTVNAAEYSSPPLADTPTNKDQALAILIDMFPQLCTDKQFNINLQTDSNGDLSWYFHWQEPSIPMSVDEARISASINAVSGKVSRFSYQPSGSFYEGKSFSVSKDQARQIAEDFLDKYHQTVIASLQITEDSAYRSISDRTTRFMWARMENGIMVDQDGVNIAVDHLTGQIHEYSYIWTDCEFPPSGQVISASDLLSQVLAEYGVCPVYRLAFWDSLQADTAKPIYILNTHAAAFNAVTGQPVDMFGRELSTRDAKSYHDSINPQQGEMMMETRPSVELPANQLKQTAADFFNRMGLPSGEVRNTGGGSNGSVEHLSYSLIGEDNEEYMRVDIDINTGNIVGFNQSYPEVSQSAHNCISYEEALQRAWDIIDFVSPDKANQLILSSGSVYNHDDSHYDLSFSRLVNGIPYDHNGINMAVHKYSGHISSYGVDWTTFKYSSLTDIITPQEALEAFKEICPLELKYLLVRDQSYRLTGKSILVYSFDLLPYVDGISGKKISISNDFPTQSQSHWAAPALTVLKEKGVLPADLSDPDASLTRRQALGILQASVSRDIFSLGISKPEIGLRFSDLSQDDPDQDILVKAIRSGMIVNQGSFNSDRLLTREDLAVWLTNALGYRDIAQMENQITLSFNDADLVAPELNNYMAIISGLGILTPDQYGNIRPQAPCTLAELAVVFIRMESRLQPSINY